MNNNINPTESLKEANEVCGNQLNNSELIDTAESIILGDATPSVARPRALEPFLAARALNEIPRPIDIITLPCGTIKYCTQNTPYELNPLESSEQPETQLSIIESEAKTSYTVLFGDPVETINNKYESAKNRAINKKKATPEEAEKIAREKTLNYAQYMPATLFGNSQGLTMPELCQRDYTYTTLNLAKLLNDRSTPAEEVSNKLRYLSALDSLNDMRLEDAAELFRNATNQFDSVAFTCTCPECSSQSGREIIHAVGYTGKIARNYGSFVDGSKTKPGCKHMKPLVNLDIDIRDFSLKELIQSGFRPQGLLIYLLIAEKFYTPGNVLALRDYSNPRGTVKTASERWKGRVAVTPRAYIKTGDRDANSYELVSFIRDGGAETVKKFSSLVPPRFTDGRTYTLDLQSRQIKIDE